MAFAGAVINVGELLLAREAFHAGTIWFGLLASGSGSGLVVGSVLAPRVLKHDAARVMGVAALVNGAGFGAAALAPGISTAAPLAFVGGAGNALLLAAAMLVVQRTAPSDRLGRVFAGFVGMRRHILDIELLAANVASAQVEDRLQVGPDLGFDRNQSRLQNNAGERPRPIARRSRQAPSRR